MPVDESAELQQLIMMSGEAPDDQVENVLLRLSESGSYGRVAPGRDSIVISAFGDPQMISSLSLEEIPGVEKVLPVSKPYKLVSAETQPEPTVIQARGRRIGGGYFGLIAGPCTVESREQTLETARAVNAAGATMLRGGAFKPRTSPYSFQGLGSEALKILAEAREDTGLPLVTEVLDPRQLEEVVETADVLQIGARNMQNFLLLAECGKTDKPVLLKRGASASIEELLMAAEYILKEGNPNVLLCERGIRTFETAYRYTLDLTAVPVLKELTHLPVIVDPSHAAGRRSLVTPLSLAAAAAGADGIIVEVHPQPEEAICDGPQALVSDGFADYVEQVERAAAVAGKVLSTVRA
jgi:3-deoxy-7-phosphoheptulonate synthase